MKDWMRLLLDPAATDLSGGGGAATTSDDPAGNDGVLGDTGSDPTTSDDPAAGLGDPSTPTPTPTATQQNQWQSIRDVAKARGYDASQGFQDDATFLDHLLQQANQARQSDFHARLGQSLAPHAQRIQQFLGQPQQPAKAEAPQPWEAPEYDERWLSLCDRDPGTGIFIAKPGADPSYAAKVNAFATWKQNYDRNPAAVLNGMVEARAKSIAAETVREQLAIQGRDQTVRSIVAENTQWMYQRDAAGQPVTNYLGQPMMTPVGTRYMHHLQQVKGMGVTDPRHQDFLAKQAVQAEHYASQAQAAAAAAGQGNPQARAATNAPNINPIQTAPPGQRRVNPHDTPESTAGRSLSDMMRAALSEEGVTDQDVYNSIGN